MKAAQDVYSVFARSNPNIRTVLSLGNVELESFPNDPNLFNALFEQLKNNNVEVISTAKKDGMANIKPYTVVEDEVEGGEKQRVLIIGTTTSAGTDDNLQIENLRMFLKGRTRKKSDKLF
jgi:predicted RNA-binding protein with TRAM domain